MTNINLTSLKARRNLSDKEVMRKIIKNISLILFFSGLLIPFNNCSYIDTSVFDADQGSLSNGRPSIQFNAPNPLRITNDIQIFTISGSCSAGIHPDSNIFWSLHTANEIPVSDSFTAGGAQFFSTCVNSRYSIDVRVPCPGAIQVGPNCFGLLEPLRLRLRIQGITATGAEAADALGTSVTLTLNP